MRQYSPIAVALLAAVQTTFVSAQATVSDEVLVRDLLKVRASIAEAGEAIDTNTEIEKASLQLANPSTEQLMKQFYNLSIEFAERNKLLELPLVEEIDIPAAATPELEQFLLERARLANGRAALENSVRAATFEMREKAIKAWYEEEGPRLTAQEERAEGLSKPKEFLRIPSTEAPTIPESAPAAIKEFLLKRHTLWLERLQEEERIHSLVPEAQEEAKTTLDQRQEEAMTTLIRTLQENQSKK